MQLTLVNQQLMNINIGSGVNNPGTNMPIGEHQYTVAEQTNAMALQYEQYSSSNKVIASQNQFQ